MNQRRIFLYNIAASSLAYWSPATVGAQSYPSKPIRLVVPFPAGSTTDMVARTYATHVSQALGQPIVIENKAGADGLIAGQEVARAAGDGHTLFLATNSPMAAGPAMKKNPPYDPLKDFSPIADLGRYTFFMVVHPSVPANSLDDLVKLAKESPGKLSYATGNTTGILGVAQFCSLAGIQMTHVPYKGEPQAMLDLLAGRVQAMMVSSGTSIAHLRDGKIRALAVATSNRSPLLPNVPTMVEAGVTKFTITSWAALYGPANMPKPVIERLNREFMAAAQKPEVKAAMEKIAFIQTGSTPEGLATHTKEQYDSYRSALLSAGITPE